MDDKDRLISELEGKVAHLTKALKHIDADVAGAAKRYLRCNPGGLLEFSEFLDLLVLEVREVAREKNSNQLAMKERMKEIVRERLEVQVAALIPTLKGRLSDYLVLQVVILRKEHAIKDHLLVKTEPFFKAFSIRGEKLPGSIGMSAEGAYQELRTHLACEIFAAGPEAAAKLLGPSNWELVKHFNAATPFMEDTLEGFKVDVRLVDKDPKA